jgi:hypothetical protein
MEKVTKQSTISTIPPIFFVIRADLKKRGVDKQP